MSNETVEKFYEGQPPAAPMPEAPIDSGAPVAMSMPSSMPPAEAAYGAEETPEAAVIEMDDYPDGRGGMNAVPMSEGPATEAFSSLPGEPIGEMPPETEMPA
jgi:hypothetical protein